jgi:hypothetical protein
LRPSSSAAIAQTVPGSGEEILFDEIDLYAHPSNLGTFYAELSLERVRGQDASYYFRYRSGSAAANAGSPGERYGEIQLNAEAGRLFYLPRAVESEALDGLAVQVKKTNPESVIDVAVVLPDGRRLVAREGELASFPRIGDGEWHAVQLRLAEMQTGEGPTFPEKPNPKDRQDDLRYFKPQAGALSWIELGLSGSKGDSLYFDRLALLRPKVSVDRRVGGTLTPPTADVAVVLRTPDGRESTAASDAQGRFALEVPAGATRYEIFTKFGKGWQLPVQGRYFEVGSYLTPVAIRLEEKRFEAPTVSMFTAQANDKERSFHFKPFSHTMQVGKLDNEYMVERFTSNWGYLDRDRRIDNPDGAFRVAVLDSCRSEARQVNTQDFFGSQVQAMLDFEGDLRPVEVMSMAETRLIGPEIWPAMKFAFNFKPDLFIMPIISPAQFENVLLHKDAVLYTYDPAHPMTYHFDVDEAGQLIHIPPDPNFLFYALKLRPNGKAQVTDWSKRLEWNRAFHQTITQLEAGLSLDDPAVNPDVARSIRIYAAALRMFVEEARKNGAQLALAYGAEAGTFLQGPRPIGGATVDEDNFLRFMQKFAEENGALFYNLYPDGKYDLVMPPGAESAWEWRHVYAKDGHWSPAGHRYVAESTAGFIRKLLAEQTPESRPAGS